MNHNHMRGNAFFITLVSVALLGALTFVVGRQMSGGVAQSISDEKAELYANQLINHATQAQIVIEQMMSFGVGYNELDFELPDSATFHSGNTMNKVYHPSGGGLLYPKMPTEIMPDDYSGLNYNPKSVIVRWVQNTESNIEWTPTSQSDISYSFLGLTRQICEKINLILVGSSTVPQELNVSFNALFNEVAVNTNFLASNCPSCVGKPRYCVGKSGNTKDYVFYNVIYSR